MWHRKPFLILAPPNILFMDNKKSFAKINLQRIYIFIIRQYFPISCLNSNNFDLSLSKTFDIPIYSSYFSNCKMVVAKYTRDYEKNNLPENCRKVVLVVCFTMIYYRLMVSIICFRASADFLSFAVSSASKLTGIAVSIPSAPTMAGMLRQMPSISQAP